MQYQERHDKSGAKAAPPADIFLDWRTPKAVGHGIACIAKVICLRHGKQGQHPDKQERQQVGRRGSNRPKVETFAPTKRRCINAHAGGSLCGVVSTDDVGGVCEIAYSECASSGRMRRPMR